jgi:hypothetical protein
MPIMGLYFRCYVVSTMGYSLVRRSFIMVQLMPPSGPYMQGKAALAIHTVLVLNPQQEMRLCFLNS